jgi:PilZ domain
VPARLRHGASWSDACILNLSSRGLMIHTSRQIPEGTQVEVRRGDHVIVARVVWRDGARAGLQSEERVPVEQIMTLGQSPALQLTAAVGERRKSPRPQDHSRLRGRAFEFAGVLAVAVSLAGCAMSMVHDALAGPLVAVSAVLSR